MTENEAKKNITAYVYLKCLDMPSDVITALDVARIALEKQIPKKPKEYEDKFYACPICKNVVLNKYEKYPDKLMDKSNGLPFCLGCGQKLDWSDKNEVD